MQRRRRRFLPKALAIELRRLPWRLLGLFIFAIGGASWLALLSWSYTDPSPNYATVSQPQNWLGRFGAGFAGTFMDGFGLSSVLLVFPVAALGLHIAAGYSPLRPRSRLAYWIVAALSLPAFFSSFPTPAGWILGSGLGGVIGDGVVSILSKLSTGIPAFVLWPLSGLSFFAAGTWCLSRACGLSLREFALAFRRENAPAQDTASQSQSEGLGGIIIGLFKSLASSAHAEMADAPREYWMQTPRTEPYLTIGAPAKRVKPEPSPAQAGIPNPANVDSRTPQRGSPAEDLAGFQTAKRMDQGFGRRAGAIEISPSAVSGPLAGSVSPFQRPGAKAAKAADESAETILDNAVNGANGRKPIIYTKAGAGEPRAHACGADAEEEEIPSILPPLSLLATPRDGPGKKYAGDPDLMHRAAGLMSVLGDFGVKGRIAGIYPGPVITLFELEPARGTKSSRVVGLADDIARSMSAVSARIAVVPGRDAIGIELPNSEREIVSLRAILESSAFQNSQAALPLALGKTIGGDPIAVDLARMPHLLIAGTTGSGKSVGINAMILSLLYRLPPGQCNFIMIDPKMLELSVYDGIPHLLAPVVTDPKKAVTALKWAVKEMNARYERMSKLGVRNVTGYNAKVAAALLRGQPLRRTVQIGFDPRTGQPIEEEEILEPISMPYIVIVIDEMADLMMCAGKDVEFAVQRLSQMARAAGIHLIMATQRPSVDVVTGTIKANFPSRISFQVTSKIDSRTIIGEQGAEQLLGAGDMLYMASGGRIMRAHGPFVSDDEVESVARYLKAQGLPNYREDILDDGECDDDTPAKANGGGGRDLYEEAVEIVLKDRKPTTSYLQRRLGIGYNRAASLIERMEQEGIVGAPGRTGRREILLEERL